MEKRFEFGQNWKDYIERHFNQERVEASKEHMLKFMGLPALSGLSFLDVGCGSGLHSFAAWQSGAERVLSFDYDAKSVQAARMLHQHAGSPATWEVCQGSVLDEGFVRSLPEVDVVYSWGVLHHTGDVWNAIRNAAIPLKPGGLFYIALYSADVQKDPTPEFWLATKQRYLKASWFGKRWLELWYIWRFLLGYRIWRLPQLLGQWREYTKKRGMHVMTDIRDWLGGWPMEFCYDDDVKRFMVNELN
ncbi:MAG: class I SAM-dependent methyltransferase, partial [Gammaproteobacteria bacterium]